MVFKMCKSKVFFFWYELVEFVYIVGISWLVVGKIVDRMVECILVFLFNMEEVSVMDGLRGFIEVYLNNVMKIIGI